MIRPFTCLCMLLAGASGLYLYQAKHRAQLLDREIGATMHAAELARERSGVLRAEWTLLNDPERLAALAGRFLALKTTQPGQFTNLAELDARMPAVRATPRRPDTTDEPTSEPAGAPISAADPAKPAVAAPPPPPVAPTRMAAAVPHPQPHPVDRRPREVAFGYGRGVANPPSAAASVLGPVSAPVPMVTPIATPVLARPGAGYAAPQGSMPTTPPPMLGSALGMARTPAPAPANRYGN